MAMLKYQKNVKLILLMLTVLFLLLVEPVSAGKSRSRAGKSKSSVRQSKRAESTSSASKIRASSSVAKSRVNRTSPSRSVNWKTTSRISKPTGRGNITVTRRTVKSPSSRPSSGWKSTQPSNISVTRSSVRISKPTSRRNITVTRRTVQSSSGKLSSARKPAQNSNIVIEAKKSSQRNYNIKRNVLRASEILKSDGQKAAKTTVRSSKQIVEPIGKKKHFVPMTERNSRTFTQTKPGTQNLNNVRRRTSKRTSVIVKGSGSRTERTEKAGSLRKSRRSIVRNVRPAKSKSSVIVNKSSTRPRRRHKSIFTSPVLEGRQHVRTNWDRSQHIERHGREITKPISNLDRRNSLRSRYLRLGHDRKRRPRIIYEERRRPFRYIRHHYHVYRDRFRRLCHRIVWPRYRYIVYYGSGPWFRFRYVYPYYHRKYIFVSLGGYWPIGYNYVRYYWYGWHPYYWYGYSPVPYQVGGDTYNYYTYNYYNGNESASLESASAADGIKPVDHNTFADVREKLAAQAAEQPAPETAADRYFEEAVQAFEDGEYDVAAEKFAEAAELAPEDIILPFAYVQALFADQQYTQAAEILRSALMKTSPEQEEGVFYPRGLYVDEQKLIDQIDELAEETEEYSFDGDLQLLLGYQLLGIGETEQAEGHLQKAKQDSKNAETTEILLELIEKIETQDAENTNVTN